MWAQSLADQSLTLILLGGGHYGPPLSKFCRYFLTPQYFETKFLDFFLWSFPHILIPNLWRSDLPCGCQITFTEHMSLKFRYFSMWLCITLWIKSGAFPIYVNTFLISVIIVSNSVNNYHTHTHTHTPTFTHTHTHAYASESWRKTKKYIRKLKNNKIHKK